MVPSRIHPAVFPSPSDGRALPPLHRVAALGRASVALVLALVLMAPAGALAATNAPGRGTTMVVEATFTINNQTGDVGGITPDEYAGYLRGVAVAGGSFGDGKHSGGTRPMSNADPGIYGSDWFYDVDGQDRTDQSGLAYLAARGSDVIRIDFRWERLQPSLNGPLAAAEVSRITAMLDAAREQGLKVILDLHNYGHYKTADSPNNGSAQGGWSLGQPQLPHAAFADLWRRIVEQWGSHPATWGWELMNEPVNMADTGEAATYTPATTVFGWNNADTRQSHSGGGSKRLRLSGSGWFSLGTGGVRDHSSSGNVVGLWVRLAPGSARTTVSLQLQDPEWRSIAGPHESVPADGAWHFLSWAPPAGLLRDHRAFAVYIGGSGGSKTLWLDDLTIGSTTGASRTSGREHWQGASQAAVEAIRRAEPAGNEKAILVGGYEWSKVAGWAKTNGDPWINDPLGDPDRLLYTGHHYWDSGGDSAYGNETPISISGSVEAHANRVVGQLRDFTSWLSTHQVRGTITEVGWPDNAAADDWNRVAEAWFDEADAARLHVTQWATGAAWGNYELSVYEAEPGSWSWHAGDVINSANTQAAVLEAHRSAR